MSRKKDIVKLTPAPASPFAEIGVGGLKVASGYVWEDYLTNLRGEQGIKVYQTMQDSDTTVGAILQAITLPIQRVSWNVEPATVEGAGQVEAQQYSDFGRSLMDDMSHSWTDFISEAMSMLPFGWAYMEHTFKRRTGPTAEVPSRFDDGLIGIRKIALRSQDTLQRWEMDENGGIKGMHQLPPTGGGVRFIPIEKSLLFRTKSFKNNPEGRSILRTAYRAWWNKKTAEDFEIIGVERELAGLPVVRIPSKYIRATSGPDKVVFDQFEKIARDLKFNSQGGLVIPSDTYLNKDGTPSSVAQVDIELIASGGKRAIDTTSTINRYDQQIARSALAGFLTLGGTGSGSYALSRSLSDLFLQSIEYYLTRMADVLNRYLMPRIWALNGFDLALMPTFAPGKVAPKDLIELSQFITSLAQAGMPLFPDDALEKQLRDDAGVPAPQASEATKA